MKVPRQVSVRKAAGTFAASLLIVSAVLYYVWGATPTSTFWVSPGVYPGAPSYTIWTEGGNYFAKTANGEIDFTSSNATEVMQQVADSLSRGKILVVGNIVLTGSVQIKSNQEWDLTNAYIKQGRLGSPYNNLFTVGWWYVPYNVYVHGGTLDGNKAEGTIANGIEIIGISTATSIADYAHNVTVNNVKMYNVEGTGILLSNATRCIISNNVFEDIGNETTHYGPGVRLDHYATHNIVVDNVFYQMREHGIRSYENCHYNVFSNNIICDSVFGKTGIAVDGDNNIIQGNVVENLNCSSQIISISGANNVIDSNVVVDCDTTQYAIRAYPANVVSNNLIDTAYMGILVSSYCTVSGNRIYNVTYHGIYLYSANSSVVSGNMVYGILTTSRGLKLEDSYGNTVGSNSFFNCYYGVEETTSDYNVIVNVNTRDCTFGIITPGANTHVNLCWNATTWVA